MTLEIVETEPLELLARQGPPIPVKAARREIATRLLALARSDQPLEHARQPGDLAAAFLRGYDNRRSTQEAYARDLADWFVWLDGHAVAPFDATLTTVESYTREPLPSGKAPSEATITRRMASISTFYRRAVYEDLIPRNPFDPAKRPRPPEQAATAGLSKQRARRLIAAARAEGPREAALVLLLLELGLRISDQKPSASTSKTAASRARTA